MCERKGSGLVQGMVFMLGQKDMIWYMIWYDMMWYDMIKLWYGMRKYDIWYDI